jgi:hypothetical protein
MSTNPENLNLSNLESDAIFQKRIQDLVLDLAEAESRTHNIRFVNNGFRRTLITRLESYVRRNRTLYKIALRIKNLT